MTTEALIKIFYGIFYMITFSCDLFSHLSPTLSCPATFPKLLLDLNLSWDYLEIIYDMSQYCQLMISIGRFFAVSFNGLYYHHLLKWPILQVLLPIGWRLCIEAIKLHFYSEMDQWFIDLYIRPIPIFLMCSLDLMTNHKLKRVSLVWLDLFF